MNERIKELVRQAEVWANQFEEHWGDGPDTYELFKQKFAELIVAECVKVAMGSVSDDEPKEAWYLIQEHFGVK